MYNLEKLFKGIVSVKEIDGFIEFNRFTHKQLEIYKKIADVSYLRAKCPAGVKMEFETYEKNLSFDFVTEDYCRDWSGFDVYENGNLTKVDLREEKCEKGKFSYTVKAEGKVKIEIYFMFSCILKLKNLNFGEIEYIEEEKINYLALGDSITQGMVTKSASMSYPAILGRMCNLNVLNHGVGGYWFDKKSLDKDLSFEPDIITIAYGINDANSSFNNGKDENYVLKKAKEYIKEVIEIYPHSDITIITPIWIKKEDDEPLFKTHLDKIRSGLRELGTELGLKVIDGLNLVPHDSFYFGDNPSIHPNDSGFLHYAINLELNLNNK